MKEHSSIFDFREKQKPWHLASHLTRVTSIAKVFYLRVRALSFIPRIRRRDILMRFVRHFPDLLRQRQLLKTHPCVKKSTTVKNKTKVQTLKTNKRNLTCDKASEVSFRFLGGYLFPKKERKSPLSIAFRTISILGRWKGPLNMLPFSVVDTVLS